MKNRYLIFVIISTLMFSGCNSDDEYTKDEILSGTKWECNIEEFIDRQVEESAPGSSQPFANLLLRYNLQYSVEENRKERIKICYATNPKVVLNTIKFDIGTCALTLISYNHSLVIKSTYIYDKYNIPLQDLGDIYVRSYGIFVRNSCISELENYQREFRIRTEITESDEKEYLENSEEEFHFERTGDEVVLTNKNKRIYGILDKEKWTLELTQIEPEKRELGKFALK